MSVLKTRSYRTRVARRILTLQLPPTTTAFHAHARLVLMAYLYLPHEFGQPRLAHNVRKIAAYTSLHTETVKRTRKRLVDLGVLVKVGKRPGKNGLMKDVLTWGAVLLDEQPAAAGVDGQPVAASNGEQPSVARINEQPSVASGNEQPQAAVPDEQPLVARSDEPLMVACLDEPLPVACVDELPAVASPVEQVENASLDEQPPVARSNGRPPAARRIRRPQVARTGNRELPVQSQPAALTPEEREGLGTLHQFVRRVAERRNAPMRILRALQPILEANNPEVVWDLVLRRNPYDKEDHSLLRETETLWRSQQSASRAANTAPPIMA